MVFNLEVHSEGATMVLQEEEGRQSTTDSVNLQLAWHGLSPRPCCLFAKAMPKRQVKVFLWAMPMLLRHRLRERDRHGHFNFMQVI